ncbi:MAG: pilus assembly protein [Sphingomonadaceae bacterium]|nr:pilus assembly protein [Sphingomonadaceae bacterium]
MRLPQKLQKSISGVATVELALAFPFLLMAGLWGVELANYGVMTMRINQLAIHMADNASRIGDMSTLEDRKIYEADINDLLMGANIQSGNAVAFFDNGRAIISSLEVDGDDEQYIHWQRCMGSKNWQSSYGDADDRLTDGMGPVGREIIAFDDEAVMFVEIAYDYQPLVSARFVGTPEITSIASFTVRADRDLAQIYQRDPGSPDPVANCSGFSNPFGPPA